MDYDTQPPAVHTTTTPYRTPGGDTNALAETGIDPLAIVAFSLVVLLFGVLALVGRTAFSR